MNLESLGGNRVVVIASVGALVLGGLALFYQRKLANAAEDAASPTGGLPLFQSAALPSSIGGGGGAGDTSGFSGSGTTLSSLLSNAIQSAKDAASSLGDLTAQNNATLTFNSLVPQLVQPGTNDLSGSFSVSAGTTTFHLSSSAPAGSPPATTPAPSSPPPAYASLAPAAVQPAYGPPVQDWREGRGPDGGGSGSPGGGTGAEGGGAQ